MPELTTRFVAADERIHAADRDDWSWNESWFFSWIDTDGGPAGFVRVGLLPNQRRAMLWCFLHVDDVWLGIDESRLALHDFDLEHGLAYDRWGLRCSWRPDPPLRGAAFAFAGSLLARTGPAAGAYVAVAMDLAASATGDCVGSAPPATTSVPTDRFEQSLAVTGVVTVGGQRYSVRAGGHRDRSWGPREWRIMFTIGDVQDDDRQLYFVGSPAYDRGAGYLREGTDELRHLTWVGGTVRYDDDARTITPGDLVFRGSDGDELTVRVAPIAPSVAFDMAHTCAEPEQWPYWRTLVEARVPGWSRPARGWFEASRYGATRATEVPR